MRNANTAEIGRLTNDGDALNLVHETGDARLSLGSEGAREFTPCSIIGSQPYTYAWRNNKNSARALHSVGTAYLLYCNSSCNMTMI